MLANTMVSNDAVPSSKEMDSKGDDLEIERESASEVIQELTMHSKPPTAVHPPELATWRLFVIILGYTSIPNPKPHLNSS